MRSHFARLSRITITSRSGCVLFNSEVEIGYELNQRRSKNCRIALRLMLVSIPISLLSVLNEIAALLLFRGADYLSVFTKPQRDSLAVMFLDLHDYGFDVAQVFWGLWLIPFGILVYKSGFLPRILGVLLIIACFGYLAHSLVGFGVLPNIATRVFGRLTVCELPVIIWLLIRGAKDQPLSDSASS